MNRVALHRFAACLLPLLLLAAGCGGSMTGPSNGTFSIAPGTTNLDTNTQQPFTATLTGGQPASVTWQVSNGDTVAGAGTIDANGLYTPPSYVTADSIQVTVTATLKSNPSSVTSARITVNPGFLQPLSPENSALTANSSLSVQGTISEVNGGKINWAVSTTANGADGGTSL